MLLLWMTVGQNGLCMTESAGLGAQQLKDSDSLSAPAVGVPTEYPHPWLVVLPVKDAVDAQELKNLVKKDPVALKERHKELERLNEKLCEIILKILRGDAGAGYTLHQEFVALIIKGADPAFVFINREINTLKKTRDAQWKTIKYWMNCGLIKSRVIPFGSCGKKNCFLGEYVNQLTAPHDYVKLPDKIDIATLLPDLLAFCNDPREHYMDGVPLTIILSDILFQEKDPVLVPAYNKLKQVLNTRFNRAIFLRDMYQVALFDARIAGEDEKIFCEREGLDQDILRLTENVDGKVIVSETVRCVRRSDIEVEPSSAHKKRDKNPWRGFKKTRFATRDIRVSSAYNTELLQAVEDVIAHAGAYKDNKRAKGKPNKYKKIQALIACGGDPEYVQKLITTIVKPSRKFDDLGRAAAIRSIEHAINLGLIEARLQPFGNCGKSDCCLPYYVLILFASAGRDNTPLLQEDAWKKIPMLLKTCPHPEKHMMNGTDVVTCIKKVLKKPPTRLKHIRETVLDPLRKQVEKLSELDPRSSRG